MISKYVMNFFYTFWIKRLQRLVIRQKKCFQIQFFILRIYLLIKFKSYFIFLNFIVIDKRLSLILKNIWIYPRFEKLILFFEIKLRFLWLFLILVPSANIINHLEIIFNLYHINLWRKSFIIGQRRS
jgi:hypothetical protein